MPHVYSDPDTVLIALRLDCNFEKLDGIIKKLNKRFPEIEYLSDDTRGFDGDAQSVLDVGYKNLADAVRLDPLVRAFIENLK